MLSKINPVQLFQKDLRHLVVIQINSNDKKEHIRNSYFIDIATAEDETLLDLIEGEAKKAEGQESKYKQNSIRRVCFVDNGPLSETHSDLEKFQQFFAKHAQLQEYKLYCLKEGIAAFSTKYPFLCLSEEDYANAKNEKQSEEKAESDPAGARNNLLNSKEKKLLYSYSQFPFEIVEDSLFLGNVYHSNSKAYLEDLKVRTMIDFTLYDEEATKKIPEFKQQEPYTYKNIPLDPKVALDLDFDEINIFIDDQLKKHPGQNVLLYCNNGQSISPAFAISYMMYKKKMNLQLASIKVFSLIGKVEISKWIYSQLMLYNPKK